MRLINTTTLKLREFFDDRIPSYAILSHRWEDEEYTYTDMTSGISLEKKGWEKITKCCKQSQKDGWDWVWIDSSCIDKTSSAELSEAINSMFRWYENAEVCYAYLSDVPSAEENPYELRSRFRGSKWFTRGWTLQELIAPKHVEFYNADWNEIGTKRIFTTLLESITGISHLYNYKSASVAQKMSWASYRNTTRLEDQAYCLMGLFDVNMPLLYGEGRKAFLRLQLEILNKDHDETIFAWEGANHKHGNGLLADSPWAFEASADVVMRVFDYERQPPIMTAKGLRIEVFLSEKDPLQQKQNLVPLQCTTTSAPNSEIVDGLASQTFLAVNLIFDDKNQTWKRTGSLRHFSVPENKTYADALLPTRPKVAYVPQIYPANYTRFQKTPLRIDCNSLLKQSYMDPELYRANKNYIEPVKFKSPATSDRVIGILNMSPERYGPQSILMKFQKSEPLGTKPLVIAIYHQIDLCSIEIMETDKSMEELGRNLLQNKKNGRDRSSRILENGNSINVSMKPKVIQTSQMSRKVHYIAIDIVLDKSGKLRWPSDEGTETSKPDQF